MGTRSEGRESDEERSSGSGRAGVAQAAERMPNLGISVRIERSSRVHLALRTAFASSGMETIAVIGGNMLSRSAEGLEREFAASGHAGPRNGSHPVFHLSLSDAGPTSRTDAEWATLAARGVARLGFADAAYVVVRRGAVGGDQVHVVAARVDAWGRRIGRPGANQIVEAVAWDELTDVHVRAERRRYRPGHA